MKTIGEKKKPQKHLLNSFMNISSTFSFTS